MTTDMAELFVGLVFLTVLVASQIIVLPSFGTSRADGRKLQQRLEGIILAHGDANTSIVKEKYLNRLGPVERSLEYLPGMAKLKMLLEQAGKQQMAYRFALMSILFSLAMGFVAWLYFHQLLMVLGTFFVAGAWRLIW
jgi:tight adherence protein B